MDVSTLRLVSKANNHCNFSKNTGETSDINEIGSRAM